MSRHLAASALLLAISGVADAATILEFPIYESSSTSYRLTLNSASVTLTNVHPSGSATIEVLDTLGEEINVLYELHDDIIFE